MKKFILLIAVGILIYTRFVNISWGLPYPFHPDERNMADAIVRLTCGVTGSAFSLSNCLNPHFFAYGQLPLYVGYLLIAFKHAVTGVLSLPPSFVESVVALRLVSVASSLLLVFVLIKCVDIFISGRPRVIPLLLFIFVPSFIQFAHFGTTESLLMLEYVAIIYYSLLLLEGQNKKRDAFIAALLTGVAFATKVSAVLFAVVPLLALFKDSWTKRKWEEIISFMFAAIVFCTTVVLVFFILSPQNVISFPEFVSSIRYESDVALGRVIPFYTRQFLHKTPILFQLEHIVPYALGWPLTILAVCGFVFLSWKDRRINLLRFSFLVYFLPSAFLYAKWTRFVAPVLPLALLLATIFLYRFVEFMPVRRYLSVLALWIIVFLAIVPGVAFLSVYVNQDVRFRASEWIYGHIDPDRFILSETANVVDIPIPSPANETPYPSYFFDSFNFYDVDVDRIKRDILETDFARASYIFIPSRRVFMNLSCARPHGRFNAPSVKTCDYLRKEYPVAYDYYDGLFSGRYGFRSVAEFTSYPKIRIGGKTLIEFPDEEAEESFTVFDHPVIRIYNR